MKDYTVYEFEKKNFITNYIISDNNIIVRYADNGKEKIYPYSKKKEEEILKNMEEQISDYHHIKSNLKRKIKESIIWIILSLGFVAINIKLLIEAYKIIYFLSLPLMGLCTFLNIINLKERIVSIKDLEKSKFFIDNKNIFENELKLTNDEEKININCISKYEIEELRELKEKITNTSNGDNIVKSKKLILKKK